MQKKNFYWVLAATLVCGTAMMLTSCTDNNDNSVTENPVTHEESKQSEIIKDPISATLTKEHAESMKQVKAAARARYGENKKITDGNYDKSLAVKCVNGTFVGKKADNTIVYRGIPFVGSQPVGGLRWKAPVDVIPDDGVYEAYYNGKSAPQREVEYSSVYVQGEDCLYLNVWKADDASTEKKPVMVWVHGGGFEIGGTVDPAYDFQNFVTENPDVIIVTTSYRLGVLGFLHLSHLPDGANYPDAQNLGLMDQLAALKWIHENIAGFGGDPDNVTIFGESAGAGSVSMLPLVKGSHQYFKRVIAESGSPAMSRSTEQAIEITNAFMDALGCKTVADLQKIDAETLVQAAGDVVLLRGLPERDGTFLPLETLDAYANGAAKDVDILIGCNKEEMSAWKGGMGVEGYSAWANDLKVKKLAQLTDEEKNLVESYYQNVNGDNSEKLRSLLDQIWFVTPFFRTAENQTTAGGKAYAYYFTTRSGHGNELTTVLGHPEMNDPAIDETFSKTVRKMWVQFAKTGNPSLSADISPDGQAHEWPLYDQGSKQVMVFDEFNIHSATESEIKLVDWGRTYFLTKYYIF